MEPLSSFKMRWRVPPKRRAEQSAVNPFNISIQNLEWHPIIYKNYLNQVFVTFSELAVQPQFVSVSKSVFSHFFWPSHKLVIEGVKGSDLGHISNWDVWPFLGQFVVLEPKKYLGARASARNKNLIFLFRDNLF
jgi:hypothetical protein